MTTMTDDPLLTVEQVAQRLQLNPETIRRWLKTGRMRGTRIGAARAGWRIPESEIARIVREGSAWPESER